MAVFRINFEAVNDYPALAFRPRVVSEVLRRHALSDQNAFLGLSSNRPAQQHRSEGLVTLIGGPLAGTEFVGFVGVFARLLRNAVQFGNLWPKQDCWRSKCDHFSLQGDTDRLPTTARRMVSS
jgi:hypothetical protein